MSIPDIVRIQVQQRANNRCEYCCIPTLFDSAPFQVDHIRPQKHHGTSDFVNLAWACFPCNNHKSANIAGYDPETNEIFPLFHPREHRWVDHFEWDGAELHGKTSIGRTTIDVLNINTADRLAFRQELMKEEVFE